MGTLKIKYRHDWYTTHVRANQARRRNGTCPSDQRQPETQRWHFGRHDCMGDNGTSSRPPEDRGEPGGIRHRAGACGVMTAAPAETDRVR